MKTALTTHEIKITFCTVSSSILLCSSMEAQAGSATDETTSWYRENVPVMILPATLITPELPGQSHDAYYRLTSPQGWHLELTTSGGRVSGFSRNEQGARLATAGSAVTLSLEGGYPIGLSENWVVEPQAQLINQRITLDTPYAGSGNASSSDISSWSGRVGARLKGSYDLNGLPVEPYLRTNLWHTVYTGNTVTLDEVDKISSSRKSSTVEVGLGLVARMTPTVSVYVSADYSSDVDDNDLNGLIGSLGVRMRW